MKKLIIILIILAIIILLGAIFLITPIKTALSFRIFDCSLMEGFSITNALAKKDINICKEGIKNEKCLYNCISMAANSVEECKEIPKEKYPTEYGTCIISVITDQAIENPQGINIRVCKKLENEEIGGRNYRYTCFGIIARAKKDKSICKEIPKKESMYNSCIKWASE
jgi:hypothetical protein